MVNSGRQADWMSHPVECMVYSVSSYEGEQYWNFGISRPSDEIILTRSSMRYMPPSNQRPDGYDGPVTENDLFTFISRFKIYCVRGMIRGILTETIWLKEFQHKDLPLEKFKNKRPYNVKKFILNKIAEKNNCTAGIGLMFLTICLWNESILLSNRKNELVTGIKLKIRNRIPDWAKLWYQENVVMLSIEGQICKILTKLGRNLIQIAWFIQNRDKRKWHFLRYLLKQGSISCIYFLLIYPENKQIRSDTEKCNKLYTLRFSITLHIEKFIVLTERKYLFWH